MHAPSPNAGIAENTKPMHARTDSQEPATVFVQRMDRKLVWILIALESGTLVMVSTLVLATGSPAWVLLLMIVLIALPIVLLWHSRLILRVESDRLRYAFFPFWKGGIDYRDIEGVEIVKINSMGQFGGWGIKSKFGNKGLGLIARCGPGVRIERIERRPVYATMDDAEQLASAIMERVVAHGAAEGPLPYERVETSKPQWLWLLVLAGTGVAWAMFVIQIGFGMPIGNNPAPDAIVWLLTGAVGVLMPLLFWLLRIVIRVQDDRLRVRMWPFPFKSWASDQIIEGQRLEHINALLFGGYGVRWLPGLGWMVGLRSGPGVLLRFASGKKLRIVCGEPERLLEALGFAGDEAPPRPDTRSTPAH